MIAAGNINITKVERSKLKDINLENIPFGKYFTDHMLEVDFEDGEWKNAEIKPYQPLLLDPSTAALHYGQAIFEGVKAYKNADGDAFIFRPLDNFKRFNISAERMPRSIRRFSHSEFPSRHRRGGCLGRPLLAWRARARRGGLR